jgi:hypothetical protein
MMGAPAQMNQNFESSPSFFEHIIYWEFGQRVRVTRNHIMDAQANVSSMQNGYAAAEQAWNSGGDMDSTAKMFANDMGMQMETRGRVKDFIIFIIIQLILILLYWQ